MKYLMTKNQRPKASRWLAFLWASSLSAVAVGQAVVEPSTQPTMTLAPYVIKNTNLEKSEGTRAYRPWFENGAWTGDLLEYIITKDGVRQIRTDVGFYPRDGAEWRGDGKLWSARMQFPDWQHYTVSEEGAEGWACTEEQTTEYNGLTYWLAENRVLFTYTRGNTGSNKVNFLWNNLSVNQRQALDSATCGSNGTSCVANAVDQSAPYASPLLNFIRGDRSNEYCKNNGVYRWRFSLMGDIVNSRPVYVPMGDDGLVLVGANDGMLHGFSAKDGKEVFGYIPSMLINKLGELRKFPYRHTFYVDGELRHRDIGSVSTPQHIVTGGLGAGAKGIFALDVTSPDKPEILFEISGIDADFIGGDYNSNIGYIHGRPTIAKLPDNKWYVITGNGYESVTGTAQLALIPIDGGAAPTLISTDDMITGNGLSAPSLVDTNGDGKADYAYAGDQKGNLWRFDLDGKTGSKLFSAGEKKPITVEPEIGLHSTGSGYMVFFGTGSLLSAADANNTETQSFYGIWDRRDKALVPENRLITQVLEQTTETWDIPSKDEGSYCLTEPTEPESKVTVRFVLDQEIPIWTDDANRHLGWKVDLPRTGERVIGHPQLRGERVQFITINPIDMQQPDTTDEESGSWVLQLSQNSGGSLDIPRSLFDLNKSCLLDEGDALVRLVKEVKDGIEETVPKLFYPVGLNLGPYNIAQPAIARVRQYEDGIYINALQLPPIEELTGLPFAANIDVTTDSSNGPVHQPLPEPAKEPFKERQFPEASGPTKPFLQADGLGHRVDGHSFGYNKVHGVNYIDFFDLEPRRGKLRLDVGSVYKEGATYKPINPRDAVQELNRITEVGIGADQKFIVVLTNADLSQSNELQIGCRTWPVYQYQTMMTQRLRGHAGAGKGVDLSGLANDNLIFTLNGIRNDTGCSEPTLRITPTDRVGKFNVLRPTLPGCVNNTDRYSGSSGQDVHLTRKEPLNADGTFKEGKGPIDLYSVDPHVTVNQEGQGYRWRNGALTIQLLAVTSGNQSDYILQDAVHLPVSNEFQEGVDQGWGGIYARGFELSAGDPGGGRPGKGKDKDDDGAGVGTIVPVEGPNGLLYESSIFWHWGDMSRFQTSGGGNPVIATCYGASARPSLMFETEWFTPGAYEQLTKELSQDDEALAKEYASLIQQLQSGDENVVRAALAKLAEMFENQNIADYHRLRDYVPNSKQLQEHHLLSIDRTGGDGVGSIMEDKPARVLDIERDIMPTLGPNFQRGRRSWTDITPSD